MAYNRLPRESRHPMRGVGKRRVNFDVSAVLREASMRDSVREVLALLSGRTTAVSLGDKNSALLLCCRYNSLRCARLLLERGAEVSCRDEDHWTPLHTASACGHTELVQLLLEFSADASAVDVDGNLAVDHAKDDSVASLLSGYMGHYGMCEPELQSMRAQLAKTVMGHVQDAIARRKHLNELNENGVTLLHITAASGFHEAARLLLEHGATVDVRDCHGLTPLHVAAKFNQIRMARLLLNKGADSKAIPGVPLPSLGNEILSEALSSPLPCHIRASLPTEVDTSQYSQPQPCSSFWKLSDLAKADAQSEKRFLSRNWQPRNKAKVQHDRPRAAIKEEELIYETPSPPPPLEEVYDTAVLHESMRPVVQGAWPPHHQQPSTTKEEDDYDDVENVFHKAENDYEDVKNVLNGVEELQVTDHHTYINVSPEPHTPKSDNHKRHTYVNVPSDNSLEDCIYDDCHTPPKPSRPAPYEEAFLSNQRLGSSGGSFDEDYDDRTVTSSTPTSTSSGSPQAQKRRMGRRRSRLPSSTSAGNLPSNPPLLTKSYSDSSCSSSSSPLPPSPQINQRSRLPPPPVFQTPQSWLSRVAPPTPVLVPASLVRRESTPKQRPPPPPNPRKHCGRSHSTSDLPFLHVDSVSPPSPSIPEEDMYSVPTDPDPSLQATPTYHIHNSYTRGSSAVQHPPKPLPKPRKR